MKTIIISILSLLPLFSGGLFKGQNKHTLSKMVYKPGEVLKYEMSYGWIKGGEASLNLQETTYNGKNAYHVRAIGKTTGIANTLYNVRDVYESYFDPSTGKPFKSVMNLKEGKYRNYNEVYYNHSGGTLTSKKSGKKELTQENVFDIVSAFYHFRKSMDNLQVNQKLVVHTYFHDEPWDLIVRFKGYETIKTGLGKIRCMKFKSIVMEDTGTFKSKDALDIWISADENKIPVRVKMKFFVGSFKTDLTDYSGLANPINFTK